MPFVWNPTNGVVTMLSKASDSEDNAGPWGELVSYISNLSTGTEKPFKTMTKTNKTSIFLLLKKKENEKSKA